MLRSSLAHPLIISHPEPTSLLEFRKHIRDDKPARILQKRRIKSLYKTGAVFLPHKGVCKPVEFIASLTIASLRTSNACIPCKTTTGKGIAASTVLRKLGILRSVAPDVIPRGLRADEDMHFNLNARITVNGAQSNSMHFASVHPTERGPTCFAETHTPTRPRFVLGEILLAAYPRKRARRNLGVRRTGATERLSTP